MDLKVGDTVRLKSGGPEMTISESPQSGVVLARWFEGKKLHESGFVREELQKTKMTLAELNKRLELLCTKSKNK